MPRTLFAALLAICLALPVRASSASSAKPDQEGEEYLIVLEEEIPIQVEDPYLREMDLQEIAHWTAMIYTMHQRLDIQMRKRAMSESALFKKKKRLNNLIQKTLRYYKSFPPDLEHDLGSILSRIDQAIVKLREPKYAAIVEVPVYREEKSRIRKKPRRFQFIWPVAEINVTSPFGPRRDPFTGKLSLHDGIDLAGKKGTLIYAAERGRVVYVGYKPRAGQVVVLEHPSGYRTIYAHLSDFLTVKGIQVERGQPIGLMGSTGRSTGVHLHFSIREGGVPVDPRTYVGSDLGLLPPN